MNPCYVADRRFPSHRLLFAVFLLLLPLISFAGLEQDFHTPPDSARPWTFWFWINGNISREGIKADLEAMSHAGIGGVLIMEVANPKTMAPAGPIAFASPEWRELFKYAVSEADRLHLQINMNNDAGWCGSGGPWITPELSMQKLVATTTTITGGQYFEGTLAKPKLKPHISYYRDIKVMAIPQTTGTAIASNSIIDLTDKMGKGGHLRWDSPPPGTWQILRIGCTTTGQKNKPAPETGTGFECDKFNPDAIKVQFANLIAKLCDDSPSAVGRALTMTHIDSWEVGTQDWTARMPEEFRKRRGYDLTPWLPLLAADDAKLLIGSADETRRFQWDFQRTCAELNDEAYAAALRDLAHSRGLKLSIEAYGTAGWLNPLTYGAQCDIPMAEFWINRWGAWHLQSPRLLASVAHVFGKPIVGAESFTASAQPDPFTEHPYSIKSTGDWAFSEGINRFVFHRTALNPWPNLAPGMSFAGYGWHVDTKQTWWDTAGTAFFHYVARCQALLQQGRFIADVVRLLPDGEHYGKAPAMASLPARYETVPPGYNFDYISDKALISELSVNSGHLVTRSDRSSYNAIIQLPNSREMTPELLRALRDLVSSGAVVIGPRPEHSPSLQDYPHCDEVLKSLADEMWGDPAAGAQTGNHQLGKGRVIWGTPLAEVLRNQVGAPDLAFTINPPVTAESLEPPTHPKSAPSRSEPTTTMPTTGLNWIHRQSDTGEDFYFVANPQYREVDAQCTFRERGRKPDFWDPATNTITTPDTFRITETGTEIPIHFDPAGSLFVVFRKAGATAPPQIAKPAQPAAPVAINGPWKVEFQPGRGAPAEPAQFDQLTDWSKNPDEGIRHFSGAATYRTSFNWKPKHGDAPARSMLSLGDVQVAAAVSLNGKDVGIAWKAPYKIDITDALRPGKNDLQLKVANQWPNRLIGDEQYADDCTTSGQWTTGPLPAWPDWFINHSPRPEPRRLTFTTWKYYTKDSPLLPSGLLGPVQIEAVKPATESDGRRNAAHQN